MKLEKIMSATAFWQDPERARITTQKHAELSKELAAWDGLEKDIRDALAVAEEGDAAFRDEVEKILNDCSARFARLEFSILFSGKYDAADAIVAIHAGTGGVEAMDWAAMLLRMLLRFCERHGFTTRIVDESRGAEAGVKSVTVAVEGRHAYGWLKSESGVHRLVRISPFDAEAMRHTSFALIEVLPDLGDVEEVAIDPKDIRVDTFLSSGHGGQSVQTTYSAVRVTHLSTNIVVSCQNERSQLQNKETAMKILRAKLHARAEAERQKEKQKIRGSYTSAEWGNQARSYVLNPYKLVKDHRTKFETQDVQTVLDGGIDAFVEAYLKWLKTHE